MITMIYKRPCEARRILILHRQAQQEMIYITVVQITELRSSERLQSGGSDFGELICLVNQPSPSRKLVLHRKRKHTDLTTVRSAQELKQVLQEIPESSEDPQVC
jgi:hypothetical protein